MKNLQRLLFITLLMSPLVHQAQSKADTVVINFGNSSRMVFYINEKGDLEQLKSYDLNALVSDMKDKIEANTTVSSQEDGDKYLKDSLAITDSSTRELDDDSTNEDEDSYSYNNGDNNDDDDRWRDNNDDSWRGKAKTWKDRIDDDNNIVISNKLGNNHYINFDIGVNNYLEDGDFPNSNDEQYSVKPWGSWYFAINSVHNNHIAGKLFIESGIGISWYNFKFEDASTRLVKTDTELLFVSGTADSFKKSKLTASFINLSLVPVLKFGSRKKGFRIGAGGYGGYRLGSHSKYRYKIEGSSERDKNKDNFYLNNWRYGLRLQLGHKGTDFFINYDMNELFSEGRAPKLNAFSFGITI